MAKRKTTTKKTSVKKYVLKEGIVLKPYGVNSRIDNSNITDVIAEMLISKGRAKKEDFIN